jgi:hypothetical protein
MCLKALKKRELERRRIFHAPDDLPKALLSVIEGTILM